MRIARYFAKHKIAVAVVVVLLVAQAFTDLSLPRLTSNIVDVGIQQAGIEHVAVDEMSARTFEIAAMLSEPEDEAVLRASYDASDAGLYVLNDAGRTRIEELDDIMVLPMIAAHGIGQGTSSAQGSVDEMLAAYQAGALSKDDIQAMLAQAADALGSVDEALVTQQAIAAASSEYADVGYDVSGMQMGYLWRVGLQMLALAGAGALLSVLVGFVAARTGAAIARDLREQLFERVVSFTEGEVGRFSAASLITRGTNDIQLIQMVSVIGLRMVLYAPILAIGGIIMVMTTSSQMGWVIVVAVVVVFAVVGILFKVTMPKFKIMQTLIDRVNLVAREMLTGMPVIRAFDREAFEEKRFNEASTRLMRTQLFTNRAMSFMMPAMMLVMNLTSVAIVWIGGLSIDSGAIQTGDLIAFITYSMVIIMGFLLIGMVSIMLPRADVAAARVDEVIACEPAVRDPQGADVRHLPERGTSSGAEVAFHGVCFRYDRTSECVLEHVSFTARPGTTLAIVGGTGSGKSTIVKLIERFYDVTSGSVTIDGVDVRNLPLSELRSQIGYVPQKAFLFSGTVASNVAFAGESVSDARVSEALEIAQAQAFVEQKEGGASAEIAQGGSNVSGGQRQRLAIARALASDARVLIFDDSFSALDYKTDALLRAQLAERRGSVTRIIVAQRVATIMGAECIVVLDDGRVVGSGTHDELMESCEEYRAIALSQLSEAELQRGGVVA